MLGCLIFFMPYADAIAELLGLGVSGFAVFTALAFGNFIFEIGMNVVLSPVMLKIIEVAEKTFNKKKGGKKAKPIATSEAVTEDANDNSDDSE